MCASPLRGAAGPVRFGRILICLCRRSASDFCFFRSPGGAQRNPGAAAKLGIFPGFRFASSGLHRHPCRSGACQCFHRHLLAAASHGAPTKIGGDGSKQWRANARAQRRAASTNELILPCEAGADADRAARTRAYGLPGGGRLATSASRLGKRSESYGPHPTSAWDTSPCLPALKDIKISLYPLAKPIWTIRT
jgi:hypothetical protein